LVVRYLLFMRRVLHSFEIHAITTAIEAIEHVHRPAGQQGLGRGLLQLWQKHSEQRQHNRPERTSAAWLYQLGDMQQECCCWPLLLGASMHAVKAALQVGSLVGPVQKHMQRRHITVTASMNGCTHTYINKSAQPLVRHPYMRAHAPGMQDVLISCMLHKTAARTACSQPAASTAVV
jgi:hypothetical protein